MTDGIPELTDADFARMVTRAQRKRLTALMATWETDDVTALRRWLGLTEPQFAALKTLTKRKS